MATARTITTAEELAETGDVGRCELIRGELHMMTPAKNPHGQIAFRLGYLIGSHVFEHKLGAMYAAETGFLVERDPDTLRAPDVAFVAAARAPSIDDAGFVEGAPDLAVEVLSPGDRASDIAEKVALWLRTGAKQVWVVDPRNRTLVVHQPDGTAQAYPESATLTGGDLLPGFSIEVASIFAA